MNLTDIKNLIEDNPVALATITSENKPNVIGVALVKVVSDERVLITDNYMNQTVKDMEENKGLPAKGAILVKVSKLIESK